MHQVVGIDPVAERDFLQRWGANNPITAAVAQLQPGEVKGLGAILDYEAFVQTPIFQQWGRPNGYCDVINVMLETSPARLAAVSLIRSLDDGVADAASIARLEFLAPHFLRAVRIGRVLEQRSLREQTYERALDALGSAVLLVGPAGELVYANSAAQRLIGEGLPLRRLASAAASDQPELVTLPDGVRRVAHCLPLGHIGAGGASGRLHACRLFVLKEEADLQSAVAAAGVAFGLTPRESDVLFALFEAGGTPAIGRLLGISRNTVNTHLKQLFQKTGVKRQADLVQLVSGMASPLRTAAG